MVMEVNGMKKIREESSDYKSYKDNPIAVKHKSYENEIYSDDPRRFDLTKPFLIRLDGHNFYKFSSYFERPYDWIIQDCMLAAAVALLKHFNIATCAYTQSDEITICFPSVCNCKGEYLFLKNGDIQKFVSVSASLCSSSFISRLFLHFAEKHLSSWDNDKLSQRFASCSFDARVFNVPSCAEIAENLIWRRSDRINNSHVNFASFYFGHNNISGLNASDIQEKVKNSTHWDLWQSIPDAYKFGLFVKRKIFSFEAVNKKTKFKNYVCRKRYVFRPFTDMHIYNSVEELCSIQDLPERSIGWDTFRSDFTEISKYIKS